jgi:hypothetical protein
VVPEPDGSLCIDTWTVQIAYCRITWSLWKIYWKICRIKRKHSWKIKIILNSGNVFYHSVQSLLQYFCFPSKNFKIWETKILLAVLYVCETWSLTLKEEHWLRVFENRVLRRIFGIKKEEVVWGWRRLHIEELHNLYASPSIIKYYYGDQIKRNEMAGNTIYW